MPLTKINLSKIKSYIQLLHIKKKTLNVKSINIKIENNKMEIPQSPFQLPSLTRRKKEKENGEKS